MTLALPPPAAQKLSKVCALLASDQPGEVVAAAAAGTRLLRSHGLSWADLLRPCPAHRPEVRQSGDHQSRALRVLARGAGRLSEWEREFLTSLSRQVRTPSPKQSAVLVRLEDRCR
jgi:hypothetical protein